jgi:hypothetical protein
MDIKTENKVTIELCLLNETRRGRNHEREKRQIRIKGGPNEQILISSPIQHTILVLSSFANKKSIVSNLTGDGCCPSFICSYKQTKNEEEDGIIGNDKETGRFGNLS